MQPSHSSRKTAWKLGDILGSIGQFLQNIAEPINSLVKLFSGDDSNGGNK